VSCSATLRAVACHICLCVQRAKMSREKFFSTSDEFKRKVDRMVTTTTHKFVRFMGCLGSVGRLGFRVGVSASYSKLPPCG